jgi:hypothetical protein
VASLPIDTLAIGAFDFQIPFSSFRVFGLTPEDVVFTDDARNARVVVPEPATAALCVLRLVMLAAGRARWRIW